MIITYNPITEKIKPPLLLLLLYISSQNVTPYDNIFYENNARDVSITKLNIICF